MQTGGQRIVVVTAYDALFTRIIEEAGIDTILVGDSLGVVVQGKLTRLPSRWTRWCTIRNWWRKPPSVLWLSGTCRFCPIKSCEEAVRNAGRFLQAAEAAGVKLEGGAAVVDRVEAMTQFGMPVMGHLGMTPQSVNRYGGYKVQGKEQMKAETLVEDASFGVGRGVCDRVRSRSGRTG